MNRVDSGGLTGIFLFVIDNSVQVKQKGILFMFQIVFRFQDDFR